MKAAYQKFVKVGYSHYWIVALLVFSLLYLSKFAIINSFYTSLFIPIFVPLYILSHGKIKTIFTQEFKSFLIFVCVAAVSGLFAINIDSYLRFMRLLLGVILFWSLVNAYRIKNLKSLKILYSGYLLACLFLSADILLSTSLSNISLIRVSGLYENANGLAFVLLLGVFASMFILVTTKSKFNRVILFCCIALFLIIIILTASRKTFVASGLFFAFFFLFKFGSGSFFSIRKIIFIAIGYFLVSFVLSEIESNTYLGARLQDDAVERSYLIRFNIIKDVTEMLSNNPFFGVGLGNYQIVSRSHLYAHNDFIEVLGTTGILGLLAYLAIYRKIFIKFIYIAKRAYGPTSQLLLRVWFSSIISFIAIGLGRPHFIDLMSMFFFAIMIATLNFIYLVEIKETI